MVEISQSHPSFSQLASFINQPEGVIADDAVGLHIESCVQCQARVTEIICSGSDFLDPIRPKNTDVRSWTGKPSDDLITKLKLSSQPKPWDTKRDTVEASLNGNTKRYHLIEEVARGGMGVVYRAVDNELQREVAVKVIADSQADVHRFEREAIISGQLQHPGIVPIHDYGVLANGEPFIAMKLVQGETLRRILDDGSFKQARLLEIFIHICQTVAYSHSQGIVHRDLKPANVMVGAYGEVQIMDWGLAKKVTNVPRNSHPQTTLRRPTESDETLSLASDDTNPVLPGTTDQYRENHQTLCGTVVGTPSYMPYEQAMGQPVGPTADVFALGGILYEILTGHPPFEKTDSFGDQTIAARYEDDNSQLAVSLNRLDDHDAEPALVSIVKDCLARDATQRPVDAQAVSVRLKQFFDTRDQRLKEAELEHASVTARLGVEARRRQQVFRLATIIVTVLVLATVAIYLYLNERNARQAEQFKMEKAAIKQRDRAESRIRSIVFDVDSQLMQAEATEDLGRQITRWRNATTDLHRAFDIADSRVDPKLFSELKKLDGFIAQSLERALDLQAQQLRDENISKVIDEVIQRSRYPNELMQQGRDPKVKQSLEAAFSSYGLELGSDIQQAAKRIRDSQKQPTLVQGLKLWRTQHKTYHRGKPGSKLGWFDELLDTVDPDPFRIKVRGYSSRREADKVSEVIEDARALESILTVHTILDFLNESRQAEKLLRFLLQSHAVYPNDFQINETISSYYQHFHASQPELAIPYVQICRSIQPDNPGILINLTKVHLLAKDYDAAIRIGERLIQVAPLYPHTYNNVAIAYLEKGELEKSLEYYERALKVAPEFDTTYSNRAISLSNLKRHQEALESIDQAIKLNPNHASHHLIRCKLQLKLGETQEARLSALEALDIQPSNLGALQNIVRILRDAGEFDEAIEYHLQLAKYHRQKTDTWASYGETLLAAKRYQEAETLIEGPFKRHFQPLYADVLARAQWAQGKKTEAIKTLELQLKNRPNSPAIRERLKGYRKTK